MCLDTKWQDWGSSFRKAPGSHWDYPLGVLLCSKNCVKKPLAVAGMLALLRVAVQRLRCCGWLWPPKGSRYKLTPSAALQAQPGNKSGPSFLPSSARVSELTYVTIIGARYPELDTVQNDIIQFGNYLQAEQCTRGGFLPILWDAPYSYINASIDIGEVVDSITDKFVVANKGDLAVLHNRNKMVNAFANTEWVSGSGGAIISRSVTSCAGMTAYLVLLAQTRVGFLGGGRGKSFHQLPPQEQAAQKERRGLCKGYSGPHSSTGDLLHHGPTGHAWVGRSSDYHWMLEIWCLLQWAWRPGRPCFPCQAEGWGSGGGTRWFGLSAKLTVLLCESHWSLSTTGPGWGSSLLRRTVPQGCEGCTSWLWTCTDAGGWLTGFWGYSWTFKLIGVLTSVGILSPSRGSRTKRLISSDMSLDTQWMAVTFRATFFGPPGQLNNPSGA